MIKIILFRTAFAILKKLHLRAKKKIVKILARNLGLCLGFQMGVKLGEQSIFMLRFIKQG